MGYMSSHTRQGLHPRDEVLRDLGLLTVPPRPGEAARASWAAEALASLGPDCGPCGDRLALIEVCNPQALEGDAPRLFGAMGKVLGSFFLTCRSRWRGIPPGHGREPALETAALGSHPDR